jgi:hypothetical protein
MDTSIAQPSHGTPLDDVIDTVLNPARAFSSLRERPQWLLAFGIVLALAAIGFVVERPIMLQVSSATVAHLFATNPAFVNFSDAQRERILYATAHPSLLQTVLAYVQIIAFFVAGIVCNALLMLCAGALGGGRSGFRAMWAASMHVAIASLGLMSAVTAIICAIDGPAAFASIADIARATPGLGMLAPGLHGPAGAFLGALNVFALWGAALNGFLLRYTAGVRGPIVWIAPALVTLGTAALAAALGGAASA